MTDFVVFVIHFLLLGAVAAYFIIKEKNTSKTYLLFFVLIMKVLAGWALGVLYFYYYKDGDTIQYHLEAQKAFHKLSPSIVNYLKYVFLNDYTVVGYGEKMYPTAFAFYKLITPLYGFCGGNYLLMSMYCSIFSGLGVYRLLLIINNLYPKFFYPLLISLLLFPSVLLWSAGLMREPIVIGAMCFLLVFALKWKSKHRLTWWEILTIPIFFYWILIFKYYYFMAFVPMLTLIIINRWKLKAFTVSILSIAFFIIFIFIIQKIHLNFTLSKLIPLVVANHDGNIEFSYYSVKGRAINPQNVVLFYHLDANASNFLHNLPKALYAGLFLPQITDINNLVKIPTGIENTFLFFLFLFSMVKILYFKDYQILKSKEFLWCIVFILPLALILPLTSPNLGSLARYKVAYLPLLAAILIYYSGICEFLKLAPFLKNEAGIKNT